MDLALEYNQLKINVLRYKAKKEELERTIKVTEQSLLMYQEQLKKQTEQKSTLLGSIEIMKQLIDAMSHEQIEQLKDLISYALHTIFDDRNYSLDIQISESRSVKNAAFILNETLADGSVLQSEFRDSIGGGIIAVVGLIIQVYYIMYYNQAPIIFMDEALSQISSQYLPNVLLFIDELSKKKNFKFVLISHDDRLIEYGNSVYSVNAGKVTKVK